MTGCKADDLPAIWIGSRRVSAVDPCYVIAEIGVNHNGDVALARELVESAARAGADAVKFQSFRTDALVSASASKAPYQSRATGPGSQAEMLAALELTFEEFTSLRELCDELAVDFLSTAFDADSLCDLLRLQPKALKWPSGEIDNYPLLRSAAASGLPVILSTGMATQEEIAGALNVLDIGGAEQVAILQCVSQYPAPLAEQNLRCVQALSARFGRVSGFSDHTEGALAALVARGLGMAILEKHITLDRTMDGPDHKASMEPNDFGRLVRDLRAVEEALGDGVKRPMPSEESTRLAARKSLVAARSLEAGALLAASDLLALRPSGGLPPSRADALVGRRLRRPVALHQQFSADDFD